MDFLAGILMENVFPDITFGTYGKINTSLKAKQEILILGSSRAQHHYDPDVVSAETGMTCYNTGLGGYGLLYNYALFNELIKQHKPEVVILDLSPNVIIDPKTYMKLNIFMPYFFTYSSFNEIVHLDPDFSKFKTVFKINVYNSTFYDLFRGIVSNETADNGYKGLQAQLNTTTYIPKRLIPEGKFDSLKKEYFEKIIDLSIQREIRLLCVVSPTYEKFDADNRIIDEMESLVKSKGLDFYDYSDYWELYKKPQYFKDQLHLNDVGARAFSKLIAEEINNSHHE